MEDLENAMGGRVSAGQQRNTQRQKHQFVPTSRSYSWLSLVALLAFGCASDDDPCPLAREWVSDVHNRAHILSTIDPVASGEADLAFLEPILTERRIVGLGESSHGVAEYSQVKTRLIKYLHERLGYDVPVFETSIMAAYLGAEQTDTLSASELVKDTLCSIWHTEDVVELLKYVKATRATSRPLTIAGVDLEFASEEDATRRPGLFREMVARYDTTYAAEVESTDSSVALHLWNKWRNVYVSDADAKWFLDHATSMELFYRRLAIFLESHLTELESAYADRPYLPSALWRAAWGMQASFASALPNAGVSAITRDLFMATTFSFLADEMFADKRIMLWAHDSHLFKAGSAGVGTHMGYRNMGQHIAERYGESYYMVSLLMNQGRAADGLRFVYDISPAPIGSIEGLLRTVRSPYVFLDLSQAPAVPETAWMDMDFVFRDFGLTDAHAVPRAQMDGVLFVDSASPPIFIDP